MKRIALFILLVFSVLCVVRANETPNAPILIKGNLEGLNNHELLLSYSIDGKEVVDTASVDGDNFQINVKTKKHVPAFLIVRMDELNKPLKNGRGYIPPRPIAFFLENTDISITGSVYALQYAKVKGGQLNKDQEKQKKITGGFRKELDKYSDILRLNDWNENLPEVQESQKKTEELENKIKALNLKFIKENPESIYAVYLSLRNYSSAKDLAMMKEIYGNFIQSVQQSIFGKELKDKISSIEKSSLGQLAPNFTKTSAEGKQIQLSDYRGKYVLLDFWGSWCAPCRKSHPHLVHLYQTYKEKGLVMIGIAQDKNEKAWLRAIELDKMQWPQINAFNMIEDFDIVKEFAVSGFPTKILIDTNGKIVKRFSGYDEEIAKEMDDTFSKVL